MEGPNPKTRPSPADEALAELSVIPPYKVLLHNDEITPMDFVVETLLRFFLSDRARALEVMTAAHNQGVAVVAIMPLEHAEFKVGQAHGHAKAHGFPLAFSIEPAE